MRVTIATRRRDRRSSSKPLDHLSSSRTQHHFSKQAQLYLKVYWKSSVVIVNRARWASKRARSQSRIAYRKTIADICVHYACTPPQPSDDSQCAELNPRYLMLSRCRAKMCCVKSGQFLRVLPRLCMLKRMFGSRKGEQCSMAAWGSSFLSPTIGHDLRQLRIPQPSLRRMYPLIYHASTRMRRRRPNYAIVAS